MNTTKTFTSQNKQFKIEVRIPKERSDFRRSTLIAYVWGSNEPNDSVLDEAAKAAGAPHRYTTIGEFPAVDKAFRDYNKLVVKSQREVLGAGLREVFGAFVDSPELKEIKFSRTAGCRCGCSPGFIIRAQGLQGHSIYINEVKA